MKKFTSVILTITFICSLSACGMNNTADNTSSAQTSAIETAGSEVSVETSTETVDTDVFEKDGSDVVIDTENSNVEISETSDGTKVATVKTDDGKEVKVAVKEDESGKTVVDTSKVVDDNGNVEKSDGKTEVKVDEGGNVTITKETSKPVEKSEVSQTSKPSSTSKTESSKPNQTSKPTESSKPSQTSKPSESSKVNETSKVNDTSKPAETSKPTEPSKPAETSKPTESSKPSEPSTVEVTSITLNKTSVTLEEGKTTTLTATVNPSNATNKNVTWSSDNTSIVTVNNGTVTAKKAGTTNITAKSNNGKTATCKVTVNHVHDYKLVDTIHHDAVIENKVSYKTITENIYWYGACANDWTYNKDGDYLNPVTGEITRWEDFKKYKEHPELADSRFHSLTDFHECTPYYMLFELYGFCTLDDIYNLKYDWFWKETVNHDYDDDYDTIYHYMYNNSPSNWRHECSDYCGATTTEKQLIETKEHKKEVVTPVVVTPAYTEYVYRCSCGDTYTKKVND